MANPRLTKKESQYIQKMTDSLDSSCSEFSQFQLQNAFECIQINPSSRLYHRWGESYVKSRYEIILKYLCSQNRAEP